MSGITLCCSNTRCCVKIVVYPNVIDTQHLVQPNVMSLVHNVYAVLMHEVAYSVIVWIVASNLEKEGRIKVAYAFYFPVIF